MHRFYLPAHECQETTLLLQDREAHHAAQVLRLHPPEKVLVVDGAGHEFLCEVQNVSRKMVSLAVMSTRFAEPLPFKITLLQSIPKGKIIESIIQKATELGIARIVPILSERVTTQLDEENAVEKLEKWKLTAIEAIKQCGQTWLPQVDAPITPHAFLKTNEEFELPLIASLQKGSSTPRKYLEAFVSQKNRVPQSACVWIGPEGDFTPEETESISAAGVLPITLGPLVLRCETAAIYCLSVLNYELANS